MNKKTMKTAAAALGRLGGSVTSAAKTASARANGSLGGRPRTRAQVLTERYQFAHGRSPRGFGCWAFAENWNEDASSPKILWLQQMTFTEAKKQAAEHFGALGIEIVHVLS
jgi:hypothetical protein